MNPPVTSYQYIFSDNLHDFYLSGAIVLGVILVFALFGFTGPARIPGKDGRMHNKRLPAIILLVIMIGPAALSIAKYRYTKKIEMHCGTTIGTITDRYWHSGKSHGWVYTYSYTVSGRQYTSRDVYPESSRKEDLATDTCYTVVYDTTHPANVLLDLKERRQCDGGW